MATYSNILLIITILSGLDIAAVAILLLLSNKEAKTDAVNKFNRLRIFQNKTTEELFFELAAVVVESGRDGDAVDETVTKADEVEILEVEETKFEG